MTLYNTSFMDNATNIVDLAVGVGSTVGETYLFGYMILLAFFMIMLLFIVKISFQEVLIIDSFLTSVLAILLFYGELIPAPAISYPVVILFLSIILYFFFK